MRIMSRFWMGALLFMATTIGANAQVAEFGVSGGVNKISNSDLGPNYSLDDGWKLIFRLTLNSWNHFGQEFGYGYNRTKLLLDDVNQGGMAIHQGYYNLLAYATPEGSRIRPFATGGVHFSNYVPPGASATYGQGSTKFGVNYGGGIKVRVTEKYQVRVDLRQFMNGKPFGGNNGLPVSGTLRQTEVSVGFAFVL